MRVVVGMSGGVDSAVSALLLKRAGYDVIGVFMKNWEEKDEDGVCTSEGDWRDVQQVCEQIDIPYYSVNFAKQYWDRVFTLFLNEYKAGRTPNPDVLCNREIKFKAFLDFAMQLGAEKIATGHFVQTNEQGQLLKGVDPNKEQSYFLYMLHQQQLKKAIFPVGGMTKAEVREIALQNGLPVAKKKDSTGICFIGERHFKPFLSQYLPAQPGDMVTVDGEVVGRHDGLMYYTLGQRRGLGIPAAHRLFVSAIRPAENQVVLSDGTDLMADTVWGEALNRLAPLEEEAEVTVRLRHSKTETPAVFYREGSGGRLELKTSARAPTPGQLAVLYEGETVLGSLWITKDHRV